MTALELIAAERQRQINEKGYTAEHDDRETQGKLIRAAACYLWNAIWGGKVTSPPNGWPWEPATWKPGDDPQRDLVKAGALIVAEIERIQRQRLTLSGAPS